MLKKKYIKLKPMDTDDILRANQKLVNKRKLIMNFSCLFCQTVSQGSQRDQIDERVSPSKNFS